MSIVSIKVYFEIGAYIAGIISVIFLGVQLKKERKLEEYKILQSLEEKYTNLLWKASEVSEINKVWQKIPEKRQYLFGSLLNSPSEEAWPIWEAMSDEEKNCYRFTRAGLEIFEQAYIAKNKGWIDNNELWDKWEGWMLSWKKTNSYVPYVLKEVDQWFTASFLSYFESLQ